MLQFHRILLIFVVAAASQTHLKMVAADGPDDYCESWRLAVETNNAGKWSRPSKCVRAMKTYVEGPRFEMDSRMIAVMALSYAHGLRIAKDGKDAWIFDVDQTLISGFAVAGPAPGNGSGPSNQIANDHPSNVIMGPRTTLAWTAFVYRQLQEIGFTLIIVSGRKEARRRETEQLLTAAGYNSWKQIILREPSDEKKSALQYKSEARAKLQKMGFRIHGNHGDQWSDLLGEPTATRSFKLPNPMYYIG